MIYDIIIVVVAIVFAVRGLIHVLEKVFNE